MRSKKGFTLIELMVVVLIVGILAAVAIPTLRGRIDAAKWSEGKAIMGSIASAARAWCAEQDPGGTIAFGGYPATLADLGFVGGDCSGTYFVDTDFTITAFVTHYPPEFEISCTGTRLIAPAGTYTLKDPGTGALVFSGP